MTPRLHRRRFLGLAAAALSAPAAARRHPNIVLILADDQGWGDLGIHGNTNLATPHIDSLARDGALFEHFYVCAVCAPTRAELLTGRYHPRGGVRGVSTGAERLNLDEKTIADAFLAAGYATAAFGKWHNGSQHPYHPNARGFQEYYGFTSGHWGHYFDTELDHNGSLVRGKGFLVDDLTDHAIAFIRRNRSRPFFCYLPLNTPHSPMQVPDRFYQKFADNQPKMLARADENIPVTRAALAMCENIDWNVGRQLSAIDQQKLANDTIILYLSDNGPNSDRWNGGMKGRKGTLDEGGLRAPCLIRWPGRIKPGTQISQIAGAIDLLPTLTAMAGVPLPSAKPLDGRSLEPLLLGQKHPWPDRMLFSMHNRRVSVRTQRHRLSPTGELYDLVADPGQKHDISAESPEITTNLRKAAADWASEMLPLVGPDQRPYTAGFAANTILPARDGVPHGGIRRSSVHPNCSFFTNWTAVPDEMTWNVELGRTGLYEAAIYYTSPSAGSTVELSFENSRIEAAIPAAYDPPLIGKEFDRVTRTESYVKNFKPFTLGRFRLEAGRGQFRLRALKISGGTVADIRSIALRLIQ